MKTWYKTKEDKVGKTLLAWRHRAVNRFLMKIATWSLGGFVAGIATSIFFEAIGLPDLSLWAARIVFFIVFIVGVISAFFRFVYHGLEFRISNQGLVAAKPLFGFEDPAAGNRTPGFQLQYIPWNEIREVKAENNALQVTLKDERGAFLLGVSPVARLSKPVNGDRFEIRKSRAGLFSQDKELDKEALALIVRKANEARKQP